MADFNEKDNEFYHVRIKIVGSYTYYEFDLSEYDLRRAIITPYMEGERFPFSTAGIVDPHKIRITIVKTSFSSAEVKRNIKISPIRNFLGIFFSSFNYRTLLFEEGRNVTRKFIILFLGPVGFKPFYKVGPATFE